jgi:hypothetical protein
MNMLCVRKNSAIRYSLWMVVLIACCAFLSARQENKDKDRKDEPAKASQEKPKDQGARHRPAQGKPATPAPAQSAAPQPPAQHQAGGERPARRGATEERKEPAVSSRPPAQQEPVRTTPVRPQAQPGAATKLQDQRKVDQITIKRRSENQPQAQTDQTKPIEQRARPGTSSVQQNPPRSSSKGKPPQHEIIRYPTGQPHTIRMADGGAVRRNESGRVVEVHTPTGAIIRHAPTGIRRVETVRPGGRVVVTIGRDHGYVQKPLVIANHSFVQRTYVSHRVVYTHVYRPVIYRGITLHIYTPVRYYRPSYYIWAVNPWPRPIAYRWGWNRSPWVVYYGGYFVPYTTYVSPIFWLTDYLIAESLQAAYEDRVAAGLSPAYPSITRTELTPEVKQLIGDEVRRQLDMERAESRDVVSASYGTVQAPPMFADNTRHTFVVSNALLVNSGARECTLSEGDVIQTLGVPPMNSPTADASVLASKPMECRKGSVVSIQLADLQEMQNAMRETIERGLGDLQSQGGQSGLPAPPPDSSGMIDAPFAAQVRPDDNVSRELAQVEQEASAAEQSVIDRSAGIAAQPNAEPITISLGQTINQVTAVQGQPQKIFDLGNKVIYVYEDIKITFIDGRVADVQ